MKILLFISALLSSVAVHVSGSDKCTSVLTLFASENFIAYVAELHTLGVLHDADLVALASSDVEAGGEQVINPIPVERTATNTAAAVARSALAELIAESKLDTRAIQVWARGKITERNVTRQKREKVKNEAIDSNYNMQFHPVPPGKFVMGEIGKQVEVTLTHTIEVMSTQVTQKMWVDLMEKNPSHFQASKNDNHPVEKVSWWAAVEYANRFSIKMGLEPAYDFDVESGLVKVNAPDGDIYRSGGYRLPTEAESEYLLRSAGTTNGKYYFGSRETDLGSHAWYSVNSDRQSHPVAERIPLIIDGSAFYDLHGNVAEWVNDWHGVLRGGQNPQGPTLGTARVIRSGGWSDSSHVLNSAHRDYGAPNIRDGAVGFRLVRTLK